jgi:hypothetical protein
MKYINNKILILLLLFIIYIKYDLIINSYYDVLDIKSDCEINSVLMYVYHKTGTTFARDFRHIFNNCIIEKDEAVVSLEQQLYIEKSINIKHIIKMSRNPYEMIVSGYYYHMNNPEDWCLFKMSNSIDFNYSNEEEWLKYYFKSVSETYKFIILNQFNISFPDPHNHSYHSYLNILSPKLGVLVELIRVNFYTMPRIIIDIYDLSSKPNYYYHNICLESLSYNDNGIIYNNKSTIIKLIQDLNITISNSLINKVNQVFISNNKNKRHTHQTDHSIFSEQNRKNLIINLKEYDNLYFNNIFKGYEILIGCGIDK